MPSKERIIGLTSDCHNTAYVDYKPKLDVAEIWAIEELGTNYWKAWENLFYFWKAVVFPNNWLVTPIIYRRYLQLMANGIHGIWDKLLKIPNLFNDRHHILNQYSLTTLKQRVYLLGMTSNVSTIFYVLLICNAVGLILC